MQPKENIIKYSLAVFIILCLVISGLWYQSYQKSQSKQLLLNSTIMGEDDPVHPDTSYSSDVVVYIHGEVVNPGVYALKEGDRIHDALVMAGGATGEADLNRINLAQLLKDEDQILIPSLSDGLESAAEKSAGVDDGLVNINTATLDELKTLPGVGDTIANYIIRYRDENGGFSSVEEMKNVDRIGEKTYEKLEAYIKVK